jgi:hypothetical protein
MRKYLVLLFLLGVLLSPAAESAWRAATEAELKTMIPARAPVEKERIETESRTASGIIDRNGRFVAGVVLITAGYSAEGKYSHYLVTQVSLRIGDVSLKPGEYIFGFRRGEDSLTVRFYDAHDGTPVGVAEATRTGRIGRVESFHIYPPSDKRFIQIGRFAMPYQIEG